MIVYAIIIVVIIVIVLFAICRYQWIRKEYVLQYLFRIFTLRVQIPTLPSLLLTLLESKEKSITEALKSMISINLDRPSLLTIADIRI